MELESSGNAERELQKPSLDVLIVLGVKPDMKQGKAVVSFAGKIRVAAAEALYRNGSAAHVLFVGGKTRGETQPSEARLMADYFRKIHAEHTPQAALPKDSVITVETSKDTDTNLSAAFEEVKKRGFGSSGLLTNEFHMPRVEKLAQLQGLKTVVLPAEETLDTVSPQYKNLMERWKKSPENQTHKATEGLYRFVLFVDPNAKLSHLASKSVRK